MALLSISVEILDMILAHLSSTDLSALCLTHSALRALAEPFLYGRIDWIWKEDQNPPIVLFMRSIANRPYLTTLAQEASFNGYDNFGYVHHSSQSSPKLSVSNIDLTKHITTIQKMVLSCGDQWIDEVFDGSMDAFMALLLPHLLNLKSILICDNFTRESRLLGMMLRSFLCEKQQLSRTCPPSFSRVRDFSFIHAFLGMFSGLDTNPKNADDVLPSFYLSSVEFISASIDNPVIFTWPGHTPVVSKLTGLTITLLREGHLGQILSITRKLQKLNWGWYYQPEFADQFAAEVVDLDQISMDLSHVKETLTDLTISAVSDSPRAYLFIPVSRPQNQGSWKCI